MVKRKTQFMKYFLIVMLISWAWLIYEMYTAPIMDDNGNIIKEYMFDTGKILNGDKDFETLYRNNLINCGFM